MDVREWYSYLFFDLHLDNFTREKCGEPTLYVLPGTLISNWSIYVHRFRVVQVPTAVSYSYVVVRVSANWFLPWLLKVLLDADVAAVAVPYTRTISVFTSDDRYILFHSINISLLMYRVTAVQVSTLILPPRQPCTRYYFGQQFCIYCK